MKFVQWLKARLKEPSSRMCLGIAVGIVLHIIKTHDVGPEDVIGILTGVAGFISPESSGTSGGTA